jgi:hypothetical protein
MCKPLSATLVLTCSVLLFCCQGFFWAFLALSPNAEPGLKALFAISAIVMIFVGVIGVFGGETVFDWFCLDSRKIILKKKSACRFCHPLMLITFLVSAAMLIVVVSVQLVLNAVLACPNVPGFICCFVLFVLLLFLSCPFYIEFLEELFVFVLVFLIFFFFFAFFFLRRLIQLVSCVNFCRDC